MRNIMKNRWNVMFVACLAGAMLVLLFSMLPIRWPAPADEWVDYGSADFAMLSNGPGTSSYYWDVASFSGFRYDKDYGNGVTVEYEIFRDGDVMSYFRSCSRDGEPVFDYGCVLTFEDYHDLVKMLAEAPDCKPDTGEGTWSMSFGIFGSEYELSGEGLDCRYGTIGYHVMSYLNVLEMSHENTAAA